MTGIRGLSGTADPGGATFHPVDDVDGVSNQCPQLEGEMGYTEVEWTFIGDNIAGTAGLGGTDFFTSYAEAVGLDSSTLGPLDPCAINQASDDCGGIVLRTKTAAITERLNYPTTTPRSNRPLKRLRRSRSREQNY